MAIYCDDHDLEYDDEDRIMVCMNCDFHRELTGEETVLLMCSKESCERIRQEYHTMVHPRVDGKVELTLIAEEKRT